MAVLFCDVYFLTNLMELINRGIAPISSTSKSFGNTCGMEVFNTSYPATQYHNLPITDQDFARERDRAMNHNEEYGVKPLTPEQQAQERAAAWAVIKKMTMAIFKLDPMGFSFPVEFADPRSTLERNADNFSFLAAMYLDKAYETPDRPRRLALIATGIIASLHLQLQSKKPWNPVLGETLSGRYSNGSTVYAEQTSHHPPISAFELFGVNNRWHLYGNFKIKVSSGPRSAEIYYLGKFYLDFDDGSKYEWNIPTNILYGIIYGDRIMRMCGPILVKDLINNLELTFDCWPKKDKKKDILKPVSSTVWGSVNETNSTNKDPILIIKGDYTKIIYINDEPVWNIETDIVQRPLLETPRDDILPSDSRFRLDRGLLIEGNLPEADKAKVIIEETQRREEKLRIKISK